jgi:hypothetical protein
MRAGSGVEETADPVEKEIAFAPLLQPTYDVNAQRQPLVCKFTDTAIAVNSP